MENISNLVRYGSEMEIKIRKTIFIEKRDIYGHFKEQRKALENLKKDSQLDILEREDKDYKIITIKIKQ